MNNEIIFELIKIGSNATNTVVKNSKYCTENN